MLCLLLGPRGQLDEVGDGVASVCLGDGGGEVGHAADTEDPPERGDVVVEVEVDGGVEPGAGAVDERRIPGEVDEHQIPEGSDSTGMLGELHWGTEEHAVGGLAESLVLIRPGGLVPDLEGRDGGDGGAVSEPDEAGAGAFIDPGRHLENVLGVDGAGLLVRLLRDGDEGRGVFETEGLPDPIPADQATWGRFNELDERNKSILRDILETSAAKTTRTAVEQKIGDYFKTHSGYG